MKRIKKSIKRPKRILIVRTDRMGDVILSTPVIKNLKATYPHSSISFMCRPYTKAILEGNPYLDEVIVYDKYGKHKGLFSSIKFAFFIRKKKFDWALILHPTNRAHLVTFLAGIPFRIGWNKKMGFLLTDKLVYEKHKGACHELEYTLNFLRTLNILIVDEATYFPLRDESEKFIEKLLVQYGLTNGHPFIVIHPSASCPSKRWPNEYFSQIISLIKKEFRHKIVLVSSGEEKDFCESIARDHPDSIDLRGLLSISELGSLLKRAGLFISNDSGPVHIAASLGIAVISIFGRGDKGLSPARWRPLGENSVYLHKDVGCRKCRAHNCSRGFLCLKELTPDEVFSAVKKLILDCDGVV